MGTLENDVRYGQISEREVMSKSQTGQRACPRLTKLGWKCISNLTQATMCANQVFKNNYLLWFCFLLFFFLSPSLLPMVSFVLPLQSGCEVLTAT